MPKCPTAQKYPEWVADRRLEDIFAQMRDTSRQAAEQLTTEAGHRFHRPGRPCHGRRSRA